MTGADIPRRVSLASPSRTISLRASITTGPNDLRRYWKVEGSGRPTLLAPGEFLQVREDHTLLLYGRDESPLGVIREDDWSRVLMWRWEDLSDWERSVADPERWAESRAREKAKPPRRIDR